jgi:RNA polymerase sigma-70 factor (ECF subfamily)
MDSDAIEAHVKAACAGRPEAFREIVRLTQDRLRAFILHYCPWPDAVDDVAQETYIHAYEHLREYAPGTHFLSWLRALARHRVLTHVRLVASQARRERRHADALAADRMAQADEAGPAVDRIDALRECLEKLPDRSRDMISRRYQRGESAREIGEALRVASNNVLVLLFRIRERLRLCVEQKLAAGGGLS